MVSTTLAKFQYRMWDPSTTVLRLPKSGNRLAHKADSCYMGRIIAAGKKECHSFKMNGRARCCTPAYEFRSPSRFWFSSNIKPIKKVLETSPGYPAGGGSIFESLFPYVPWRWRGGRGTVAIDVMSEKRVQSPVSICSESNTAKLLDEKLEEILRFPPLLEAFQGFCQKALCSEVSGRNLTGEQADKAQKFNKRNSVFKDDHLQITKNLCKHSKLFPTICCETTAGVIPRTAERCSMMPE